MVVGTPNVIRNARRVGAMVERPELLRRIRARERRHQREVKPLTEVEKSEQQKATRNNLSGARSLLKNVPGPTNKHKIRAATAGWSILAMVGWFAPIQFFFALLSLIGLGFEEAGEQFLWGVFSSVIPGEIVFGAGWAVAVVIGICSMLFALTIFSIRGVNTLRDSGLGVFALCCALNIAPIFNLFPWVVAWVLYVIRKNK